MTLHYKMLQRFLILLLVLFYVERNLSIKIDCDNPDSVNEDHIHYCCKHPDGHNDVVELCANETGFKLPNAKEEAIVDITADRAILGSCFGKCVFEKLKFINNDQLDMNAVRNYYTTNHGDDNEYAKEMINAFDHCHGKVQEAAEEFLKSPLFQKTRAHDCKPKSGITWACVIRQFFHNCPTQRWSNTEECKMTLEFSKKCANALTSL